MSASLLHLGDRARAALVVLGITATAVCVGAVVALDQGTKLLALAVLGCLFAALVSSTVFLAGSLTVAALLQPPLGDIGPFPEVQAAEVLVPLVLVIVGYRWITRPTSASSELGRSRASAARPVHIALAFYGLVVLANLIRTKFFLPAQAEGVDRAYYAYGIGLGMFVLVYHALVVERIDMDWLLGLIFKLSVGVCVVGVGAVAFGLPLNFGNLRYSVYDYGSGAVRVGFLEAFGMAGLALVLLRPMRFRVPAGLLFVAALVASGGRAAVLGAAIGIAVYLLLTRRGLVIVVAVTLLGVVATTVPAFSQNAQVARLSKFNSREFEADGRTFIFEESIKGFKSNPAFGTGLGVPRLVSAPDRVTAEFYEGQLEVGGHATYMSLLKNFGLAGLIPFVAALLLVLWSLGRLVRSSRAAAFFFMMLVGQLVGLWAGGNGSDPVYFFLLAGGAATVTLTKAKQRQPLTSAGS
jgi:O-antigen ligase